MSNEKGKELSVTKATKELLAVKITKEDIKNLFCPLATDKELAIALGIVKSLNLNPFIREVHFIKYNNSEKISIIVGYEVYLKRAERTGKLNGWTTGTDAEKKIAWVKIWRKDWAEPFYWEISLEEFSKNQATWKQIPSFMGKKVAIAQGFRLAFPDELGGMPYTKEEAEVYDIQTEPAAQTKPKTSAPQSKSQAAKPEAEKPAEEPTPQPEEGQEEKPSVLSVDWALQEPEGASFDVQGFLTDWNVQEKVQTKKGKYDLTTYTISTEPEGGVSMQIKKWGGVSEGLEVGDQVLLKGVKVGMFQNELKYQAQSIEKVTVAA